MKVILAAAVLGAGGLTVYALTAGLGSDTEARPGTADMATVSKISFDINTTATGELQAKNQIELRSELESESSIVEIVPEGTMVKAGDLLIRLNSDQIQTQIEEAQLRVTSGKADVIAAESTYKITESENESKIRQAKLKVELAELALEQWEKGERVQREKDIELDLDRTAKDLARLEEYFEQSKSLHAAGFLSKNELQKDEIALREARAARAKAELEENTYKNYQMAKDRKTKVSDVEEAKAELARVIDQSAIQLTIKNADRINKSETLSKHQARLTKLERQLAACTIVAPQDGLVVYATSAGRNGGDEPFTIGRRVRAQEALIVLPDTSEMVAAVRVHESLTGRMRVGQPATIKVDAVGGRVFSGRVDTIGVMAETQDRWRSDPNRREYVVRVALDRGQEGVGLKPSMRCEASITLGRVEDVPTLPIQAIFSDEAVRFVYVPRGSRYTRVPVQIGRRSDVFAEVRAGLEPGQRVLIREPAAGEVIREPWDAAQLKLAGFELDPDGKPIAMGGPGQAGPRPAMPDAGPAGAGAPGEGRGRRGPGGGPGGPGGRNRGPASRTGDGATTQAAAPGAKPEIKPEGEAAPEAPKPEAKPEVGR